MRHFDRIYALYHELKGRKVPVSMASLCERLECSAATVKRSIAGLRTLQAPVVYERERNGYKFDEQEDESYELPGLWFNDRELRALLVIDGVLGDLNNEFLSSQLKPLRNRIEKLLEHGSPDSEQLRRRVRVPAIGTRSVSDAVFRTVSSALLQRRRLRVVYHSRTSGNRRRRTVSPQRLVYYRNNWYLDNWCHERRALRLFSLDRMIQVDVLKSEATDVDDEKLDELVGGTYGIFYGPPRQRARIRFSDRAAEWVEAESWHPEQSVEMTPDGLEIEVPYGNPTELVMDILRYGPDAEVIAPQELRDLVQRRLTEALGRYS